MTIEILARHAHFGGNLLYVRHAAPATGTMMRFSIFVPPGPGPFPVLFFLAGLTCTEENFTTKAGAYGAAAEARLMIVAPDTSPRGPALGGEAIADDPAYDLGQGAGFYLDATRKPWAPHFAMETYVVRDLQQAVLSHFPADAARRGVTGHSMGGHGALTLAMRHPDIFRSVSSFAPIVAPMRCPWGEKALAAYLGADRAAWAAHDASALVAAGKAAPFDDILIDQGLGDPFYESQLKTHLIEEAAAAAGARLTVRRHEAYDHSYFFIATFVADHVAFHAARL